MQTSGSFGDSGTAEHGTSSERSTLDVARDLVGAAVPLAAIGATIFEAALDILPATGLVDRLTLGRLLIVLALAALLVAGARLEDFRTGADIAIGLLLVAAVVTTVRGGWDGAPLRFLITAIATYYVVVVTIRRLPSARSAIALVALVGVVAAAGLGISQVAEEQFTGFYRDGLEPITSEIVRPELQVRAIGSFINPNLLSSFVVLLAPIGLVSAAWMPRRELRWAVYGLTILAYVGLLLTFSRGAVLGAVLGALAVILLLPAAAPIRRPAIWTAGGLAVLAIFAAAATGGRALGAFGRVEAWDLALEAAADARVNGVGLGRAGDVMQALGGTDETFAHAHNLWLNWLTEAGPLAFLAMAFITIWLVVEAARGTQRGDAFMAAALAGMVGFLIVSLTDHPANVERIAITFWILAGVIAASGAPTFLAPWMGGPDDADTERPPPLALAAAAPVSSALAPTPFEGRSEVAPPVEPDEDPEPSAPDPSPLLAAEDPSAAPTVMPSLGWISRTPGDREDEAAPDDGGLAALEPEVEVISSDPVPEPPGVADGDRVGEEEPVPVEEPVSEEEPVLEERATPDEEPVPDEEDAPPRALLPEEEVLPPLFGGPEPPAEAWPGEDAADTGEMPRPAELTPEASGDDAAEEPEVESEIDPAVESEDESEVDPEVETANEPEPASASAETGPIPLGAMEVPRFFDQDGEDDATQVGPLGDPVEPEESEQEPLSFYEHASAPMPPMPEPDPIPPPEAVDEADPGGSAEGAAPPEAEPRAESEGEPADEDGDGDEARPDPEAEGESPAEDEAGAGGEVSAWITFEELAEELREDPRVTRNTMMAAPSLRREGRYFAALWHDSRLAVKLPLAQSRTMVADGAAEDFAPAGRVLDEWVLVSPRTEDEWRSLLEAARDYAGES